MQIVERVPELTGDVGKELAGEGQSEGIVVASPADSGSVQVEGGLVAFLGSLRPHEPAAAVGTGQDQLGHPLGMADGIGDRHRPAL